MGLELEEPIDEENDPGLGNGGLGRLAACLLNSLATLGLPGCGYGIRYNYGMFKQNIVNGVQKGSLDYWPEHGNPWEFKRHNTYYKVRFGGRVQQEGNKTRWLETEDTLAVVHDQTTPGYATDTTNTLCLWNVQVNNEVSAGKLNQQAGFTTEVGNKYHFDCISRVLYPDDPTDAGCELRLRQAYFLASATIQGILSRYYQLYKTYDNLADKIVIHLNDTHPVLAIPELMCLLVDHHQFSWDNAFDVTCQILSYTNHMSTSKASEAWPVEMLSRILPHHLQIIFEINDHFLKTLQERYRNDSDLLRRMSLIDGSNGRVVRMAWLAVVVSYKVNGVSALYLRLMTESLLADFARTFPPRFTNVTDGVTACRRLALANPPLAKVLDENIGDSWRTKSMQLGEPKQPIDYPSMNEAMHRVKCENKQRLTQHIVTHYGVVVNPDALFDMQVKRIHEHKQ